MPPAPRKLPNGRMHGLGFVHINEWSWMAGRQFGCLILKEGKVHIIGERADFGMDTESAFRRCVASEAGLRYEDTVIQVQRSDASAYQFWVPGGSMGIGQSTPQLVLAARELKKKILELCRAAAPGHDADAHAHAGRPADVSREKGRRSGCQRRVCFRESKPRQQEDREGSRECLLGRGSGDRPPDGTGRERPDAERETASGRCTS